MLNYIRDYQPFKTLKSTLRFFQLGIMLSSVLWLNYDMTWERWGYFFLFNAFMLFVEWALYWTVKEPKITLLRYPDWKNSPEYQRKRYYYEYYTYNPKTGNFDAEVEYVYDQKEFKPAEKNSVADRMMNPGEQDDSTPEERAYAKKLSDIRKEYINTPPAKRMIRAIWRFAKGDMIKFYYDMKAYFDFDPTRPWYYEIFD